MPIALACTKVAENPPGPVSGSPTTPLLLTVAAVVPKTLIPSSTTPSFVAEDAEPTRVEVSSLRISIRPSASRVVVWVVALSVN